LSNEPKYTSRRDEPDVSGNKRSTIGHNRIRVEMGRHASQDSYELRGLMGRDSYREGISNLVAPKIAVVTRPSGQSLNVWSLKIVAGKNPAEVF
jgi:hypothetical protein